MKVFHLILFSFILIFPFLESNAYEVIKGEVFEITGPDDLDLDPENVLLAVDVFGNNDSLINDVYFYSDRVGLGDQVTSEGTVEKGGVTITTSAANKIDNWAGAPLFLSLIHISEPTRLGMISYAVFCLKKKIIFFV